MLMQCEICGQRNAILKVRIEGAELSVCNNCGKGAKIIGQESRFSNPHAPVQQGQKSFDEETTVVENYAEIISKAIKDTGLTLEEFARKINEKETYLRHIERGEIMPNEKLVKKLEKELGIKLTATTSIEITASSENKKTKDSISDIADLEGFDEDGR